jgi:hypothetical protein
MVWPCIWVTAAPGLTGAGVLNPPYICPVARAIARKYGSTLAASGPRLYLVASAAARTPASPSSERALPRLEIGRGGGRDRQIPRLLSVSFF